MEDSTQFNLEASVRKWSDDLAGQPALTLEARNELETHLRDTLKELCALGINPEESFWLSCRRVGPSSQLGEEYAKENPIPVWRIRTLWVATALLAVWMIQGALVGIGGLLGLYELRHLGQTRPVASRVQPRTFQRAESALKPKNKAWLEAHQECLVPESDGAD